MRWRFNDGTTVHLGGQVDSTTIFGAELRAALADPDALVGIHPIPSDAVPLDLDDPALLDAWLRDQMARPYRRELRLRLLEAPDVPELPPPPDDDPDVPDDVVY